ncbi:Gpb1p NDAI_0A08860 [Naumovozyma dairenensis CBS 421]|uniref:Uncharacterized protein n=1 Tax=Naumovozyma dairenensis (strain ATCC 10597 / BCRC 20456 / CBS 421 / NBRC 0211 / NRRL Y-12639) TaxID=1071378 RepID=G0W5F0_NAUDC|nr:hypothetical protein NDAI_0A08860 [Naumovozyma dairenensis CBS 421]CCD23038.1 hypothetical protein NDAI_0A08860 [Naumovozyma dairenensis CBS 421]
MIQVLQLDYTNATQFPVLTYLTNYTPVLMPLQSKKSSEHIRSENEFLLKKYYAMKKPLNLSQLRTASITSSTNSELQRENNKITFFVDHFKVYSPLEVDQFKIRYNQIGFRNNSTAQIDDTHRRDLLHDAQQPQHNEEENEHHVSLNNNTLQEHSRLYSVPLHLNEINEKDSYLKYYSKLLTVELKDMSILQRHNLWEPVISSNFTDLLVKNNDLISNREGLAPKPECPLFISGLDYIPKAYDNYSGSSLILALFSEYKLPSLMYQCSIEFNGQLYIFGGLSACYRNDDEIPNMSDFYVDPIANLPPPLSHEVINNPIMINNPHLYVISINSQHLSRPEIWGHIPPPLLCMTASKLTERHIVFYGGFEIKTEVSCDTNGKYYLKKSSLLNNTFYILDTVTFKFSKVEVIAQPNQFVTYPTFSPRFGHMQVSIENFKNKPYNNHNTHSHNNSIDRPNIEESNVNNNNDNSNLTDHTDSNSSIGSISKNGTTSSSSYSTGVSTILIFGGYRQTGEDKYEAMNDMWELDIPIVVRGKKSYYKFADTVTAIKIPIDHENGNWPSPRAFFAYSIPDTCLLCSSSLETRLLERLKKDFCIDSEPVEHSNTRVLFGNVNNRSNDSENKNNKNNRQLIKESSLKRGSCLLDPRMNNTASPLLVFGHQQHPQKKNGYGDKSVLVLHGGSNNNKVFGDMWWFNIETKIWSKIDTHAKTEKDELIPIEMKLVGHTMVDTNFMSINIGGLTQEDVNELYKTNNEDTYSGSQETPHIKGLGHSIMNVFDLNTQCLQNCVIATENNELVLKKDDPDSKIDSILCLGSSSLQCNGTVVMIGGVVARRSNLQKLYLRGVVLEFILPSMSLAG